MSEVQTVRGDQNAASTVTSPEFVDVTVNATGAVQSVPAHFIGDPVLGRGLTPVHSAPQEAPQPAVPAPAGDVQLVAGDESNTSHTPAVRDAVAQHEALVEEAVEAAPPTENDTHAVIDAYAEAHGIDLGEAKTRAEKVAVIDDATTDQDDTGSSDQDPRSGEEN